MRKYFNGETMAIMWPLFLILISVSCNSVFGLSCYSGTASEQSVKLVVVTCGAGVTLCQNSTHATFPSSYGCATANFVSPNGCTTDSLGSTNTCYCNTDLCNPAPWKSGSPKAIEINFVFGALASFVSMLLVVVVC